MLAVAIAAWCHIASEALLGQGTSHCLRLRGVLPGVGFWKHDARILSMRLGSLSPGLSIGHRLRS